MFEQVSQVLIVGAGPSGLMLAYELSRRGIPIRIIERDLNKSPYSKAIAVQIRTQEIFSSLALLGRLMDQAQTIQSFQINTDHKTPITLVPDTNVSQFIAPVIVDQSHTELVLEEALSKLDVAVERGFALVDFCQDHDGVLATIKNHDGSLIKQRFKYIVGADGAHSIVRKKMTNAFIGSNYDDAFILADAECSDFDDHHTIRVFFKAQGFLAMIPMFAANHYRLISVRCHEKNHVGLEPTNIEFQELLNKLVPFEVEIKKLRWVSRFFVQCRSADHYHEGSAFLVGDAAHIHSPAGGQGMNTGLQDAFNLGWKLAMVLNRQAHDSLLLTYHQERKPVGDYLINFTDRFFKFMVASSRLVRILRRFFLPLLNRKSMRERIFHITSQTAIRYHEGAVCTHVSHIQLPHFSIGVRIPNMELIDSHLTKTNLHSIASKTMFSIFLFIPQNIDKKSARIAIKLVRQLSQKFSIDSWLVFADDFDAEKIVEDDHYLIINDRTIFYGQTQAFFIAVRADHHLSCLGSSDDFTHLDEYLSLILGVL